MYERAVELIDAANADDTKVLAHGRRVAEWVAELDPGADEAQLLAARASHLRRWEVPRASYPDGRAGYLRWRTDQKRRHADDVAALLRSAGYDEAFVERVQRIVRKEGLTGGDAAVQTHEDALCLELLESGVDELVDSLGDDKVVEVLRKTVKKMSPAAIEVAGGLPLDGRTAVLLQQALR